MYATFDTSLYSKVILQNLELKTMKLIPFSKIHLKKLNIFVGVE